MFILNIKIEDCEVKGKISEIGGWYIGLVYND